MRTLFLIFLILAACAAQPPEILAPHIEPPVVKLTKSPMELEKLCADVRLYEALYAKFCKDNNIDVERCRAEMVGRINAVRQVSVEEGNEILSMCFAR